MIAIVYHKLDGLNSGRMEKKRRNEKSRSMVDGAAKHSTGNVLPNGRRDREQMKKRRWSMRPSFVEKSKKYYSIRGRVMLYYSCEKVSVGR